MQFNLKSTLLGVAAVAALGGAIWYSLPFVLGVHVTTVTVTRANIVQTIVATGRVETPSIVSLGLATGGVVSVVAVSEGDRVAKGNVLVRIDDGDAQAALEQAQAAVHQSQARLSQIGGNGLAAANEALAQALATFKNTQQKYERIRQLAVSGLVSEATMDDAKQAQDIASSQVRNAEAAVATASPKGADFLLAQSVLEQSNALAVAGAIRLANTKLLAPADGVIISRTVEVGMVVQSGAALLQFAPAIAKRLVLQIDERNLGKIKLGLPAIASPDAYPHERFDAVLSFINPIIDSDRGSFEVKLDVPKPPANLKEGMTVSVDIEIIRRDNALVLDTNAIRDLTGNKPHVFVVVDGRVMDKSIVVGATGGGKTEISSGLVEDELVVPLALTAISLGQKVRVNAVALP